MIVNILIATIDDGIDRIEEILLDPRPDVKYIVSHQVTAEEYRREPAALEREDVVVEQLKGRGISRNRNNAIAVADGDIALLADDDVRYRQEYINALIKTFNDDSSIDVACFKIATSGEEESYKDYAERSYLLNEEVHHYVSSMEIAFRLKAVKNRNIVFDQRFGLGSKFVSYGEEAVFIHDCIKAGLKVKYVPVYIVEHSAQSATKIKADYTAEKNIFKGAYDARRFGWLAFPAAFLGAWQLRAQLKKAKKPAFQYLRERLRGAWHIYRQGNY